MCEKALFLFLSLKYAGPRARVCSFVAIWLTHVQTRAAYFYWILKKERERNNLIKSFSHPITAVPAGFFLMLLPAEMQTTASKQN